MRTRLADLLGITHPIVLGPFGGLSSVGLTAAVSEAGGLGSYGLYGYPAEKITEMAAALRAATSRPFALNLWIPRGDEVSPAEVDLAPFQTALAPVFARFDVAAPAAPTRFVPDAAEQFDAVLEAAPAVLSVVFGVPDAGLLERAHARGIRVIGTATTVAEAVALDQAGVDAIVASGAEAGGHRVSFQRRPEDSLVGTFALVPQVVDAVRAPVIAAGGISDRRGVAAAFALGAEGVQVGSAFLRTAESAATTAHRTALGAAADTTTVLTRALSGRLARGIPNALMRAIETSGEIAPFPAQNWLTAQVRGEAARRGDAEYVSLWAGQAAGLARADTAAEAFAELASGLPR